MSGRLLTAREVGQLLGIAPGTVLRWTRAGELPAFKLPSGAVRYREDDVEAWLEARATPGRGALTTTPNAARLSTLPSVGLTTTDDEES